MFGGFNRRLAHAIRPWRAKARGRAATIRRLLEQIDSDECRIAFWTKVAKEWRAQSTSDYKELRAHRCIARIDQAHLRYERRMEQEEEDWWFARMSRKASEETQRADKAEAERDAALEALREMAARIGAALASEAGKG